MLLTAIVFLLILSILVFVHEFGHFISAKRLGIGVEEFGFGLPPRIIGIKRGETIYSINLLPIGGFVKLVGEDPEEIPDNTRNLGRSIPGIGAPMAKSKYFWARSKRQRAIVLLSGVTMNFLLGVSVFSFLFTQGVMVPTDRVHIEKISPDSPAAMAGLKEGDRIKKLKIQSFDKLRIDLEQSRTGQISNIKTEAIEIKNSATLIETTKKHLGEEIILEIERCEKNVQCGVFSVQLVPRKEYPVGEGPMGIVISNFEEKKYSLWQAPFLGTKEAFSLSWLLLKGIGQTLWKLISFQSVGKEVAGPVGIAQLTGEAVKFGKMAILEFLGLLSLNLAIINILPFPALDGGRLLFVGIEAITGKKVRATWEKWTHQMGMAILLALLLLITVNDILRILHR